MSPTSPSLYGFYMIYIVRGIIVAEGCVYNLLSYSTPLEIKCQIFSRPLASGHEEPIRLHFGYHSIYLDHVVKSNISWENKNALSPGPVAT